MALRWAWDASSRIRRFAQNAQRAFSSSMASVLEQRALLEKVTRVAAVVANLTLQGTVKRGKSASSMHRTSKRLLLRLRLRTATLLCALGNFVFLQTWDNACNAQV